jgi:beta-lactam-binding protein with PASTA domain
VSLENPTWPSVALAVACGVLLGALVTLAVTGDDAPAAPPARTVTVAKTVTVPPTTTTPGTVIVRTLVPDLVGARLDVAKDRLAQRKFEADVEGVGFLGGLFEHDYRVVKQSPAPGTYLEQGSSVRISVEK